MQPTESAPEAQGNLTRKQARERASLLSVDSYSVHLDLTGAPADLPTFTSTSTVHFTASTPGAATFIDITAERLVSAVLNGRPLTGFDGHRLALVDLQADNELTVVAECRYMRTGEGLHRHRDPVDGEVYLYSQFETFDAHRVYACFDQPDLKARFDFVVDAPAHWLVISNVAGHHDSGRWVFPAGARMSTYVTAVIAGAYHEVRDEHDGIPLGLYCRKSLAEFLDAENLFEVTKAGFDFYHRTFGYRYPFGKYDQIFVPEFNSGAMENIGAVTFLEDYVFRSKVTDASYARRAETILHELAHMWFGNLVTMTWWDDLWLNESFASYVSVLAEAEATRFRDGWSTFATVEKTWAYRQDQLPSTHPIATEIPDIEAVNVNFDGITYAKGASALKQLVAYLGRDAFFAGLRSYFTRFEFANATLAGLLEELGKAAGRDLSNWSKEWLQTAGVNTLRPLLEVGSDGTVSSLSVAQEAAEEHPTLRTHRIAVGCYQLSAGTLERTRRLELEISGPMTSVPQLRGASRPDLLLLNDDDLTYAKVRLDSHSLDTLVDHVSALRDPLARALCWGASWDMTRDGEFPASRYVTLVLSWIGEEPNIGLLQNLQRLALTAIHTFAAPRLVPALLARYAQDAHRHLLAAEPGSDHQLAWVRAFAAAANSVQDAGVLSALLDGTQVLPGLSVDTELRWHLLHRLVVLGAADEIEIDAELDRDRTAAGERHAYAARAARPDAAAKQEAWRLATADPAVPNAVQEAVISGFAPFEQQDLLRPYRDRYFEVVDEIWRTRTREMAQNVVVGLYPATLIEPETLVATDAHLASSPGPPALRRLLLEGRAGVARALAARERDEAEGVAPA
ncbi:MAG: aminopeptidase N [Mycobacteriales bacterium]